MNFTFGIYKYIYVTYVFVCCIMNFFHSSHIKKSICTTRFYFCFFSTSVNIAVLSLRLTYPSPAPALLRFFYH